MDILHFTTSLMIYILTILQPNVIFETVPDRLVLVHLCVQF